jgi:hypothetical protein
MTLDPVQELIDKATYWWNRIVLSLKNEDDILIGGESMKINPSIGEPFTIHFERLESEPSPRRKVAQQLRRSQERTHRLVVERAMKLCASLYVSQRH